MKRKGLSLEEKCEKMVELFRESRDVFTLKQLEPLAQKQKGIISQSVKQVIQIVVSDALVDSDKIGSGQYYWSFPSQAVVSKRVRLEKVEAERAALQTQVQQLEAAVAAAEQERVDHGGRLGKLEQHSQLKARLAALQDEKLKYAENDPEALSDMALDTREARDAATRWTDNIFSLRQWACDLTKMDSREFDKAFGIPEDFDYIQ